MFLLITLFSFSLFAQEQELQLNIQKLSRVPKSLFLIKQAKLDKDVGEPILSPAEMQSKLIQNEKIFNKYRLEVFEND